MKRVWKYNVMSKIEMPPGSIIVSAGFDPSRQLSVWAEVPVDFDRLVERKIGVFGTGYAIPDDAKYVDTFIDGPFVYHIYDLGEKK